MTTDLTTRKTRQLESCATHGPAVWLGMGSGAVMPDRSSLISLGGGFVVHCLCLHIIGRRLRCTLPLSAHHWEEASLYTASVCTSLGGGFVVHCLCLHIIGRRLRCTLPLSVHHWEEASLYTASVCTSLGGGFAYKHWYRAGICVQLECRHVQPEGELGAW